MCRVPIAIWTLAALLTSHCAQERRTSWALYGPPTGCSDHLPLCTGAADELGALMNKSLKIGGSGARTPPQPSPAERARAAVELQVTVDSPSFVVATAVAGQLQDSTQLQYRAALTKCTLGLRRLVGCWIWSSNTGGSRG